MDNGFTLRHISTRQLVEELSRRKGIQTATVSRGQRITVPGGAATILFIEQGTTCGHCDGKDGAGQ